MRWEKGAPRADPNAAVLEALDSSTSPVSLVAACGERGHVVHIIFLCFFCIYYSCYQPALILNAQPHHVALTGCGDICGLAMGSIV